MEKLYYPALFHRAEEGGFWVTFPDIPECITEGDDMAKAYEMAVNALGLSLSTMQESKEAIPVPSSPDKITLDPESFLAVVEFDMAAYKKKNNPKSVKKTLTIPGWMKKLLPWVSIFHRSYKKLFWESYKLLLKIRGSREITVFRLPTSKIIFMRLGT